MKNIFKSSALPGGAMKRFTMRFQFAPCLTFTIVGYLLPECIPFLKSAIAPVVEWSRKKVMHLEVNEDRGPAPRTCGRKICELRQPSFSLFVGGGRMRREISAAILHQTFGQYRA